MSKNAIKGKNDLATTHPNLAKEWHPTKNGELTPFDVTFGSTKKVWWQCENGHEWETKINGRKGGKIGCPYCSGRFVIKGENDLETVFPKLAKEWHPTKNGGLTPSSVMGNSSETAWWQCENGHEWKTKVSARKGGKIGCPYCSGRFAIKGENDLETVFPELAKEWHPTKNGELQPSDVKWGSSQQVWWQCEKGHEWKTSIYNRQKTGCPICAQELQTSFPEQALFYYIKECFSDAINRDTHLGFELDIYIPSLMVAIEYDGQAWHQNAEKDEKKNALVISNKIHLIRIREEACPKLQSCEGLTVISCKSGNEKSLTDAIQKVMDLLGGHKSIDIKRDRNDILSMYLFEKESNSLASVFPELAKEWHPTRNGEITPKMVNKSSSKRFWWVCEKGHEWEASINGRNGGKIGCPYCSNKKVLKGYNDLATLRPDLEKQWHFAKNSTLKKRNGDPITPYNTTINSHYHVWWIMPYDDEYGNHYDFEWEATIASRSGGLGCPYLSGNGVWKGFNDLASKAPQIAEEWDCEKNGNLTPNDVTSSSHIKVWWIGKKCRHSFQQTVHNRTKGYGCPICSGKQGRLILKVETGELFETLSEAAQSCGKKSTTTISTCCNNKKGHHTAYGFHWQYVEKKEPSK